MEAISTLLSNLNPLLVIAFIIATIVPIVVLWVIFELDMYGTGDFRNVATTFSWGLIAFGLAVPVNRYFAYDLLADVFTGSYALQRIIAPISEEILKAIILFYLVRKADFTYFVDGAIYGFSAGVGFAVIENYAYMLNDPGAELGVAIGRVMTTNLIHAAASGLAGISFGMSKFKHNIVIRILMPFGGLAFGTALHMAFNNLVTCVDARDCPALLFPPQAIQSHHSFLTIYAILLGFSGIGIIVYYINQGLKEERAWVDEKIGEIERVTSGEAELAKRIPTIRELLAPLAEKFGEEKALKCQELLKLQAQLGIYTKAMEEASHENKAQLEERREMLVEVQEKMEALRKQIGVYCMLYLRNIFPEDIGQLWNTLDDRIAEAAAARPKTGGTNLWGSLENKTSGSEHNT